MRALGNVNRKQWKSLYYPFNKNLNSSNLSGLLTARCIIKGKQPLGRYFGRFLYARVYCIDSGIFNLLKSGLKCRQPDSSRRPFVTFRWRRKNPLNITRGPRDEIALQMITQNIAKNCNNLAKMSLFVTVLENSPLLTDVVSRDEKAAMSLADYREMG